MKKYLLALAILFVSRFAMATDQYVKVDNATARVTRTVVDTVRISDVQKQLTVLNKKLLDDNTRCTFISAATEHKIKTLNDQVSALESVGVQASK